MSMNGKKKYLISILFACLIAGQIGVTYAEDISHLEVSTKNIYLSAGRRSNVTIQLLNAGSYDLTEIDFQLVSATPGLSVVQNVQKVFNKIVSEKSVAYDATLYVDQNLVMGSYTLTLQGSYLRQGRSITLSVPVTVVVTNAFLPMVKLTVSPSTINAGEKSTVGVKVENIADSDLVNVDLTVASSSPLLSIENQLNFNVSELRAGESASFDVQVKALESTPIGAYSIAASVYYSDVDGNRYRQSASLPLETIILKSPIITVTNLNQAPVHPGDQFEITLKVACSGAAGYNARATLTLDQRGLLSPVSGTTAAVGDLAPGEDASIRFGLLLDGAAPAGQLPITVTVKYIDSKGAQGTATEVVTIPVEEIVDFGLMQDATVTAEKGETTTFEADLLLVGTGRVEFTKIEVQPEGPIVSVSGSAEYIGAVDPDSPVPFTLKFAVANDTANGANTLKLKVSYLDNRNAPQSQTISVRLNVVDPVTTVPTQAGDGGIWGWLKRIFGLQ